MLRIRTKKYVRLTGRPSEKALTSFWPAWTRPAALAAPVAALAVCGLMMLPGGEASTSASPIEDKPYDAGLQTVMQLPDKVSGKTLDVRKFGATSNKSRDDDSAALRNAIAAASSGDEVYIPDGTYHLKQRRIELKTGVSVRGQSKANTVLVAQFDTVVDNDDSYIFSAKAGVNNLTVSNLRITSSTTGQQLEHGFWLGTASGTENVSKIALRNLQIEGFHKMAIGIRQGDNITIENNIIKNALALGGGGEGYGVMLGYDRTRNNRVAGNTIGPNIRHAVLLQYKAHHNLIENNKSYGTVKDAYDLHGEAEYSNELRNNLAKDCGESGFGVGNTGAEHSRAGPDNWIHHNEVSGCKYGISIYRQSDRQVVEDNDFHHNTAVGMYVKDDGARDILFARNGVRYNAVGVELANAPGVRMLNNTVTHNTGTGLRTDASTTGYKIEGNDFRLNGANVVLGSTDGIFTGNLQ